MVPFSIQYSKVCSRVVQALLKRQIQTLKNSWYLVHLEFLGKTLAWTNQGLKGQPFAWHKDEGGVLVGLFAHHDGNNFETNCVKKASLLLNPTCRCKKKRFDETLRDHTHLSSSIDLSVSFSTSEIIRIIIIMEWLEIARDAQRVKSYAHKPATMWGYYLCFI